MGGPGRPKKSATMDVLAVRMPNDLVDKIDAYIELIKMDYPLFNISRADAVRQLITAGIEAEKSRLAKGR